MVIACIIVLLGFDVFIGNFRTCVILLT